MNKDFFNSAARWGLILGVVLSASRIYESEVIISGELSKFVTVSFEWFFIMFLYIYILYRANKAQSLAADPAIGYPYRRVINYSILISIFAGAIVGMSSHMYIVSKIGGYDIYTMQSIESIMSVLKEANVSSDVQTLYDAGLESVKALGENPPSIFRSVLSIVANYIISGFFIGVIVGLFTKRAPQAQEQNNDNKNE